MRSAASSALLRSSAARGLRYRARRAWPLSASALARDSRRVAPRASQRRHPPSHAEPLRIRRRHRPSLSRSPLARRRGFTPVFAASAFARCAASAPRQPGPRLFNLLTFGHERTASASVFAAPSRALSAASFAASASALARWAASSPWPHRPSPSRSPRALPRRFAIAHQSSRRH